MSLRNTSKTVAAIRKAVVPHPTVKAPWQWGVVASFTTTPPLTCDVYINGTQNLNNPAFLTRAIRYLESYVPTVNDVVLIGHGTGGLTSDRWIIGDLAGEKIPIKGTITEITSVGGTVTITDPSGPVVNLEVPPGGITEITSTDVSVTITDPTGPITDLSVNWGAAPTGCLIQGTNGFVDTCSNALNALVITPSNTNKKLIIGESIGGGLVGQLASWDVIAETSFIHWVDGGPGAQVDLYLDPNGSQATVGYVFTITHDHVPGVGTYVDATWASPAGFGFKSLTGAGTTATPGDLTQAGGFEVNSQAGSALGIQLINNATAHPILFHDTTGQGVTVQSDGGTIAITGNGGASALAISNSGSGGTVIDDTGTGGIFIHANNPTGSGVGIEQSDVTNPNGLGIGDLGTYGVTIQYVTTGKLGFFNATPIVQPAAIASPTGGAIVDTEARTAIDSILAALGAGAGGLGLTA